MARFRPDDNEPHRHWNYLGGSALMWTGWQLSSLVGIFAGGKLITADFDTVWQIDAQGRKTVLAGPAASSAQASSASPPPGAKRTRCPRPAARSPGPKRQVASRNSSSPKNPG